MVNGRWKCQDTKRQPTLKGNSKVGQPFPVLSPCEAQADWPDAPRGPTPRTTTLASVITDGLSVLPAAEPLIRLGVVDVLAQEMHRTIREQELRSADMHRPEAPAPVPVAAGGAGRVRNLIGRGPRAGVEVVDRHGGGGMRIAGRILAPERAVLSLTI